MRKTGNFSKLAHVTIKALRRHGRIGLLLPSCPCVRRTGQQHRLQPVSGGNGYPYGNDQLSRASGQG